MEFLEAKEIMKQKMGDWKIMALASCEDKLSDGEKCQLSFL